MQHFTTIVLLFAAFVTLSTATHGHNHQHIMANPKSLNGKQPCMRFHANGLTTSSLQDSSCLLLKLTYDWLYEKWLLRSSYVRPWVRSKSLPDMQVYTDGDTRNHAIAGELTPHGYRILPRRAKAMKISQTIITCILTQWCVMNNSRSHGRISHIFCQQRQRPP